MAKGKHSTALFEVINKPGRATSGPPPVVTRAPLHVPPGSPPSSPSASPLPPRSSGDRSVQLDPDRHQISLRISYTSALVTAFAVIVIVVLAYLVGRGVKGGPQLADATTEEVRTGPAQPSVMDVTTAAAPSSSPRTTTGGTPATAAPRQTTPAAVPTVSLPSGPVAAPTNVRRTIGQNYVIMQSYPDEDTAKEAHGVLLANGIACTIERGPSGWVPMSWYSVVGTQAFDRIKDNPQYEGYIRAVNNVKYGEKSKFKKFDPRAYRWK